MQAAPYTREEGVQALEIKGRPSMGVVSPPKPSRHSQLQEQDRLDELIRANRELQNALEQAERRCEQLEKRIEVK
jgi:hypothetical protein